MISTQNMPDLACLRWTGILSMARAILGLFALYLLLNYNFYTPIIPIGSSEGLALIQVKAPFYMLMEVTFLIISLVTLAIGISFYQTFRKPRRFTLPALGFWVAGSALGLFQHGLSFALIEEISRNADVLHPSYGAFFSNHEMLLFNLRYLSNFSTWGLGLMMFCGLIYWSLPQPRWLLALGLLSSLIMGWFFGTTHSLYVEQQGINLLGISYIVPILWDISLGISILQSTSLQSGAPTHQMEPLSK